MKEHLMLAPTLSANDLQCFAQDYQKARQNFLRAVNAIQMAPNHRALSYAGQGPHGESLHTDTLWLGKPEARRVVVLISGTHGVEGFAGSAIQIDLLQRLKFNAGWPEDFAFLLIHALNPYGFAWLRRCNEDGIDLNRNFVDFTQTLPHNAGHAAIADAIIPPGSDWEAANRRLMAFHHQHGQRAYELAVSGGQYTDAQGMFFGGTRPSQARLHIEALMEAYRLSERQLAVIDIHTGLGPFGYGEIICDHAPGTVGVDVARHWFGDAVTLPADGSSTSVPKHGLLDYAWHAIMNQQPGSQPGCFVTLEFGTYSIENMFEALRHDHWLHARGPVDWQHPDTQRIKAGIRKQFYPDTQAWQAMVLFQGRQTIEMAIRGLLSE